MSTSVAIRQEIQHTIERLPEDQLPALWRFLQEFLAGLAAEPATGTAPIYQVHRQAIATGVPDLAHQHDHYLYGLDKRDA